MILFFLANYDLSHVPCLSIYGFSQPVLVNYYFPRSFSLHLYDYSNLDPIVLIGKYIFISVVMTTRHGYKLLIYLDNFSLYVYNKILTSIIPRINHLRVV